MVIYKKSIVARRNNMYEDGDAGAAIAEGVGMIEPFGLFYILRKAMM